MSGSEWKNYRIYFQYHKSVSGQECLLLKIFAGGNEQINYHNYEVNRNKDFLRNPSFFGYPERVPFGRIQEGTLTQRLMNEEL